ncbi:MAG: hypothetical protein NTX64_10255 [Elusimicrobia bacterium]|nr:hypothetical protein [Elusimicrobiota bacterium]
MPDSALARDLPLEGTILSLSSQISDKLPKDRRLLISEIHDRDGRLTYLGRYLSGKLQAALSLRPGVLVVSRQRLDVMLDEIRLQQTGLMEPHTVADIGKMLGADTIVYGTVTDLEKSIDVDLTIQQIESGVVIGTAAQRLKKSDELASLLHGIILSERKQNDEDLASASQAKDADHAKVEALREDSLQLNNILKTGVWRGGPTFEYAAFTFLTRFASVDAFRPAGFWIGAGAAMGSQNHLRLSGAYQFKPQGIGIDVDYGHYSGDTYDYRANNNFQAFRTLNIRYIHLLATYQLPFEHIPLPGIATFCIPWTVRPGAGIAYSRVTESTYSKGGGLAPNTVSATFRRIEPMVNIEVAHYFMNSLAARFSVEKIITHRPVGSFDYDGIWWSVELGYRLF